MTIGGSERTVTIQHQPTEALNMVRRAFEDIGKVKSVEDDKMLVRGSTRYGLQKVRLKASVAPDPAGSVVTVKAQGDDVWGKAAKSAVQRLADALEGGRS